MSQSTLATPTPRPPGIWSRVSGWPKELLLTIGAVYLLPLAILAIFIPLALAVKGVLIGAGWAWNAFW